MITLDGARILVTGGTGSLGRCLVRRLLAGELCHASQVIVFSRGEAKQHAMRLDSQGWQAVTDEVIYKDLEHRLQFVIGDVRDSSAVAKAFRGVHYVIHAAALKQVPTCEYNPYEAVQTNIIGSENVVKAACNERTVLAVVGVSTDKAVKPVNVYGITKAIQERLFGVANLGSSVRFVTVRYGNVLGSRGSVLPLFRRQIEQGGPVTITSNEMTRFFFTLDQAVDTIFAALQEAKPGEVYVPRIPSIRMVDLARAMVGKRKVEIKEIGIRPGEKTHELLVSEEERKRVLLRDNYYVIQPILPETQAADDCSAELATEYSSADHLMEPKAIRQLLDSCQEVVPCE